MARLAHRTNSRRAAVSVALTLFIGLFVAGGSALEAKMRLERLILVTAAGEKAIEIEIAETPEDKMRGLMFRTSLDDDKGMLFPYGEPQEVTMWMKNTFIPLDMVFIRADGIVHRIEARTEPMSERIIASKGKVTAVLELAGGAAERLGLKANDKVRHAIFKTK